MSFYIVAINYSLLIIMVSQTKVLLKQQTSIPISNHCYIPLLTNSFNVMNDAKRSIE